MNIIWVFYELFYDNTGAIALAKEPRFHKKTRHIKRRFNSIRENVQDGGYQEALGGRVPGQRLLGNVAEN